MGSLVFRGGPASEIPSLVFQGGPCLGSSGLCILYEASLLRRPQSWGADWQKNKGNQKKYKQLKKTLKNWKKIKNWGQGSGPLVPSTLAWAPLAYASLMRLPD